MAGFLGVSNNTLNILTGGNFSDINTYLSGKAGLSVGTLGSNVLNTPRGSAHVLFHLQRAAGEVMTSSQIIGQIVFNNSGIFIRRGRGNGTSIVWEDWVQLDGN